MPDRILPVVAASVLSCGTCGCDGIAGGGPCSPGDIDGITGGSFVFDLAASDTAFSPPILKAQNLSHVTVTLTNKGTGPHGFVVDCVPTPNVNGCPTTSCFPDAAAIGPLAPDASAVATFVTPRAEGIYTFRSDVHGDTRIAPDGGVEGLAGQFIVQ